VCTDYEVGMTICSTLFFHKTGLRWWHPQLTLLTPNNQDNIYQEMYVNGTVLSRLTSLWSSFPLQIYFSSFHLVEHARTYKFVILWLPLPEINRKVSYVSLEVLIAMLMKIKIFGDVILCWVVSLHGLMSWRCGYFSPLQCWFSFSLSYTSSRILLYTFL
jgi:hypothetical protein